MRTRCYFDNKPCDCQDDDCSRDPFRGPSFREEMDEEYETVAQYTRSFWNEDASNSDA